MYSLTMEPLAPSITQGTKPLKSGINSIRTNVQSLMSPLIGRTRQKAIQTIARKNNISLEDAQYKQAIRIAQKQARKPQ